MKTPKLKKLILSIAIAVVFSIYGYVMEGASAEEIKTYVSDWFYVTTGSETTIDHYLDTEDLMIRILYAETDGGTPYECALFNTDSGQLNGPQVKITSANQLIVRAGDSYVFKSMNGPDHKTDGYYKLIAVRID